MIVRRLVPALLVPLLLLAACRKAEITTYRVPKEKDVELPVAKAPAAAAEGAPAMASTPVNTAQGAALTWTAPAHWQAKPAAPSRKATFAVPGEGGVAADLSITAFGGDVGGELANLNRWRGQLQLPPIGEGELASASTHTDYNGLHMTVVDLVGTGPSPQRILGAMIPFSGATWFVKLMGPAAVVAKEKPAFDAFLASVKPAATP